MIHFFLAWDTTALLKINVHCLVFLFKIIKRKKERGKNEKSGMEKVADDILHAKEEEKNDGATTRFDVNGVPPSKREFFPLSDQVI